MIDHILITWLFAAVLSLWKQVPAAARVCFDLEGPSPSPGSADHAIGRQVVRSAFAGKFDPSVGISPFQASYHLLSRVWGRLASAVTYSVSPAGDKQGHILSCSFNHEGMSTAKRLVSPSAQPHRYLHHSIWQSRAFRLHWRNPSAPADNGARYGRSPHRRCCPARHSLPKASPARYFSFMYSAKLSRYTVDLCFRIGKLPRQPSFRISWKISWNL